MRVSVCVLALVCVAVLVALVAGDAPDENGARAKFAEFKQKFNKQYLNDAHEQERYNKFKAGLARADDLGKKNPEAVFGVTQFADLGEDEFQAIYLNYRPGSGASAHGATQDSASAPVTTATAAPTIFDWRTPDRGASAVTAVKDQGNCGSCWAFSAVETLESAWIVSGQTAVNLSPQQVVSCDTANGGCRGGDTVSTYRYMKTAGLQTEADYPYKSGVSAKNEACTYNANKVAVRMSGFTYAVPPCAKGACNSQNEAGMIQALYDKGPMSICVNANAWQYYISGIMTPSSGCKATYSSLNHCVQMVGYNIDPATKTKYWVARNQWGTSWGEAGYMKLSYGSNTCGIADEATHVTL